MSPNELPGGPADDASTSPSSHNLPFAQGVPSVQNSRNSQNAQPSGPAWDGLTAGSTAGSAVAGSRATRFWRLRTIRARLALIVAVPTTLLMLLAGAGVAQQLGVTAEADAVTENVELVLATQDLINSLQRERALTNGYLGGNARYRPQMDAQRRASDQNRTVLDRLAARSESTSGRAVRGALQRLSALESLRGSIDKTRLDRSTVLDFYTSAIVALNSAADDDTVGRDDNELRRSIESLRALGAAKEAIALERGQLNGVFAQDRFTQDDYRRFTETRAVKLDALARFRQLASTERTAALDKALRTPQATLAGSYEQRALDGAEGSRLSISAARWSAVMTTVGYDLREIQRAIGDDVRNRARQMELSAQRTLALYGAGAGVALLVALLLWLYTFRAIVRPLRWLTSEAHEAAERRLPGAVDRVRAAENPDEIVLDLAATGLTRRDDEFAEVATALENLQETAVRLAVEQAVMRHNTAESLANLGRRNQNLVRRQLGFISALEREEADPNALANLFELDHLATRMRRNAESLLVLVGEHSPRRWSGAVAVGDVMRSAFAEVEDYRRVILRRADPAQVQGAAAAEISHLLAELVDNALSFSPPDMEVEVQARATGHEYHIAIVDQGVGMTPEAMAVANARLSGTENFLVSPTRDLGHYVVGRLALRLGIKVWLHDSPLNGVTARVVLPAAVLITPDRSRRPVAAKAGPATDRQAQAPRNGPGTGPLPAVGAGPDTRSGADGEPVPVGAAPAATFGRTQRQGPLTEPPAGSPAGPPEGRRQAHGTGPHYVQGTGPHQVQGTGPHQVQGTGPHQVQGTGPLPVQGTGPFPGSNSGPLRVPVTGQYDTGDQEGAGGPWTARTEQPPMRHPVDVGPATTRNGLVKRTPQDRTLRRPIRPVATPAATTEKKARTPNDVRSMLTSFRAGVQRAEQGRSGEPPQTSQ